MLLAKNTNLSTFCMVMPERQQGVVGDMVTPERQQTYAQTRRTANSVTILVHSACILTQILRTLRHYDGAAWISWPIASAHTDKAWGAGWRVLGFFSGKANLVQVFTAVLLTDTLVSHWRRWIYRTIPTCSPSTPLRLAAWRVYGGEPTTGSICGLSEGFFCASSL